MHKRCSGAWCLQWYMALLPEAMATGPYYMQVPCWNRPTRRLWQVLWLRHTLLQSRTSGIGDIDMDMERLEGRWKRTWGAKVFYPPYSAPKVIF